MPTILIATRSIIVLLLMTIGSVTSAQDLNLSSDTAAWLRGLIDRGSLDTAWVVAEQYSKDRASSAGVIGAKALSLKAEILHDQFNYGDAIHMFERSLEILGDRDVDLEFDIRGLLLDSYKYQGSLDLADLQNEHMLDNIEAVDERRRAQVYYQSFLLAHLRSENDQALAHALIALKLMEETDELSMAATMKSEIGVIYHQLDEDSLASNYHREALEYFISHDEMINASFVYMERGSMNIDIRRFQEAEIDLKSALEIAEREGSLSIEKENGASN